MPYSLPIFLTQPVKLQKRLNAAIRQQSFLFKIVFQAIHSSVGNYFKAKYYKLLTKILIFFHKYLIFLSKKTDE